MLKRTTKVCSLAVGSGIFASESNFEDRYITDINRIKKFVEHLKGLGMRIVLTQGTWDMVHIGHARYLERARAHGDFLIVGVDSDAKVRARKGPERPVVPHTERLEILSHLRCVDVVFLKELADPKWMLIKAVKPDVLIATKQTYNAKQLKELKEFCGEVVVMEPMATTSTSAKIRLMQLATAKKVEKALTPRLLQAISDALSQVQK